MKSKLFKLLTFTSTTLSTTSLIVSCGTKEGGTVISQERWNILLNDISNFQDLKISIYSINEDITIPKENTNSTYFSGVTLLNAHLWNTNPTDDEIKNHFRLKNIKYETFHAAFLSSKKWLTDTRNLIKESATDLMNNWLTDVDNNINQMFDNVITVEEFLTNITALTESASFFNSLIMIDGVKIYNPQLQVTWNSKLYEINNSQKQVVREIGDLIINVFIQHCVNIVRVKNKLLQLGYISN